MTVLRIIGIGISLVLLPPLAFAAHVLRCLR